MTLKEELQKCESRIIVTFSFLGLRTVEDVNNKVFDTSKDVYITFDAELGNMMDARFIDALPKLNWYPENEVDTKNGLNLTGAEPYSIFRNRDIKADNVKEVLKNWSKGNFFESIQDRFDVYKCSISSVQDLIDNIYEIGLLFSSKGYIK